jgi:hypothetical protein
MSQNNGGNVVVFDASKAHDLGNVNLTVDMVIGVNMNVFATHIAHDCNRLLIAIMMMHVWENVFHGLVTMRNTKILARVNVHVNNCIDGEFCCWFNSVI